MPLEDYMRLEIRRLEQEIAELVKEMEKLSAKLEILDKARKKKESDLKILKSSFGETERKELQTTLAGVI